MQTKNTLCTNKKKTLHSIMLLVLLAPTLLSSSLALAEEPESGIDQTNTSQTIGTEETLEGTLDSSDSTESSTAEEVPKTVKEVETDPGSESQGIAVTTMQDAVPMAADADVVTIPDAALKQEIVTTLNLPVGSELTKTDMERLTSLYLNSSNSAQISSLSGLEYATNLATIYINTDNNVTDFSPLEKLSSLTYVTLQTASLTSANFPDLTKSGGITNLSLGSTDIDNDVLPKIAQLTQLNRIYLDSNMKITTIEPLKNLPNLTSLSVQFCGITDFTVIPDFPVLNNLAAFGQNTGRYDEPTTIGRSSLDYDIEQQTVFLPFSMMPNRMTNFDGYVPPFSTSNSASNTYFDFNGQQLPSNRLQITDEGITVLGVTEEEFKNITSFEYNARLNNPAGTYAQPDGFSFYAISSGTYLHQFNVLDDGQPVTVQYKDTEGSELLPAETLTGFVGKTFAISTPEIVGYTLKETIGNPSGSFTDQEQTVTFIYEEASVIKKKGQVIAHYVDTDNNTIKDDFVLVDVIDVPFNLEKPEIEGYTFKEVTGPTSGKLTEEDQEVTYIYTKNKAEEKTDPSKTTETTSSTNKSTANNSTSNSNETTQKNTAASSKKALPNTGEKAASSLLVLGIILVVGAVAYFIFRKNKQKN